MLARLFVMLLCLVGGLNIATASAPVSPKQSVHIIPVTSRTAEEALQVIEPFLAPGAVAKPHEGKLIIRTTPENFKQIRSMLQEIDTPAKQMIIEVKQGSLEDMLHYLSLHRDATVYETHTRSRDKDTQHVRATEGKPAFIEIGKRVPSVSQSRDNFGNVISTVEYQDVTSGFYVTPSVVGDKVQLVITRHHDQLDRMGNMNINVSETGTTITVPFSQWVNLSGTGVEKLRQQLDAVHYRTRTRRDKKQDVFLKVFLLP